MVAVGAYAWDSSRSGEIADGVTIGGVDVSGMNADEATVAVKNRLVKPLRKKITATYDGVRYQLSPDKLKVDADVDGMVERALEKSQEGGIPGRVWRYATGGEVDVAISPQVSYSSDAIDEFVGKVATEVNTDPVNATIQPTTVSLRASPATTGSPSTSRPSGAGSSPWSSSPTIAGSPYRSTGCTRM